MGFILSLQYSCVGLGLETHFSQIVPALSLVTGTYHDDGCLFEEE